MQQRIETKLQAAFEPVYLTVENESHRHSVPPNSETHFKVVLVTDRFDGKRAVARHQAVYKEVASELAGGVHALALHTYTESEWATRMGDAPVSPNCMGGSKKS